MTRRMLASVLAVVGVAAVAFAAATASSDDTVRRRDTSTSTSSTSTSTSSTGTATSTIAPPEGTTSTPAGREPPGSIVGAQRMPGVGPGVRAWRLRYTSRTGAGAPIEITAMAYRPERPAPAGGWPLLDWAHSTVGLSDACAPSRAGGPPPGLELQKVIDAGWAVVVSDYEGLGTPGIHPYLDAGSEVRSILDAARAARRFAPLGATAPVALWGYSQGGHAVLHASQSAGRYAPELPILGAVAAAAPASADWFEESLGDVRSFQYPFLAAVSWAARDPALRLDRLFTPAVLTQVERVRGDGATTCPDVAPITAGRRPDELVAGRFSEDPAWRTAVMLNALGRAPATVPVLLQFGELDELVPPKEALYALGQLCGSAPVQLYLIPGGSHISAIDGTVPLAWLGARLRGAPMSSQCAASPP